MLYDLLQVFDQQMNVDVNSNFGAECKQDRGQPTTHGHAESLCFSQGW